MLKTIELRPFDTLFFKDGKPFDRGEETSADGIFPPNPSTVYGALRSAFLADFVADNPDGLSIFYKKSDETIKKAIGSPDNSSECSLKLRSISIADRNAIYFPLPFDMAVDLSLPGALRAKLLEEKILPVGTSLGDSDLLFCLGTENMDLEQFDSYQYLLPLSLLQKYRRANYDSHGYNIVSADNLWQKEPKVGIQRQQGMRTTKDGCLYRLNMNRLREGVSLRVEFEQASGDPELTGIIKLGKEAKSAYTVSIEGQGLAGLLPLTGDIVKYICKQKCFKVLFMTPAIFKKNWEPVFGENIDSQLTLVSAATGKSQKIGGWKVAQTKSNKKDSQKEMYLAHPPGAVFYYRIDNGGEKEIKDLLKEIDHHNHGVKKHEGFGYALVAACEKELCYDSKK